MFNKISSQRGTLVDGMGPDINSRLFLQVSGVVDWVIKPFLDRVNWFLFGVCISFNRCVHFIKLLSFVSPQTGKRASCPFQLVHFDVWALSPVSFCLGFG